MTPYTGIHLFSEAHRILQKGGMTPYTGIHLFSEARKRGQ